MRRLAGVLTALTLLLAGSTMVWWITPAGPLDVLRRDLSPLARLERDARPDLGARVERWRMIDARGDTTEGLWRPAPAGTVRPWTAVMLGGIGTGERAALLMPDGLPAHVLAVDWPWRGGRRLEGSRLVTAIPSMRAALFRTPACLALGLEAVGRDAAVDTARVALLGASLGVPPAIAALRLTERARALVLIDGFAGLESALRFGIARETRPRWLATPLAALGARLLDPLEPAHHAAALGLPALVVNAERDERIPRECVDRLRALLPHATLRWRGDTHVLPERRGLIAQLALEAVAWLDSLPAR